MRLLQSTDLLTCALLISQSVVSRRHRNKIYLADANVSDPWQLSCDEQEDQVNCTLETTGEDNITTLVARPLEIEAAQSRRIPLETHLLRSVSGPIEITGRNASTSRYFGILSNLDGSDTTVPRGLFFTARVHSIVMPSGVNKSRSFSQAAYFSRFLDQRMIGGIGTILNDFSDAHNLNAIILPDRVLGVGGSRAAENDEASVHAYTAKNLASVLSGHWLSNASMRTNASRSTIFDGSHLGCTERRDNARYDKKTRVRYCFFDGKHSLVYFKGRFYLYARSNLQTYGGRFVQFTSSLYINRDWEPFRLVDFLEFDKNANSGQQYDGNIYYAAVNVNPVDNSSLLGLFPLMRTRATHSEGYIALSLSCDGQHWSKLTRILSVPRVVEGRPVDMPVDGFVVNPNDSSISFYVQRHVPDVAPSKPSSKNALYRYEFDTVYLRRFTKWAKRKLSDGRCPRTEVRYRKRRTMTQPF